MKPRILLTGIAVTALLTPIAAAQAAPATGVDRFQKVTVDAASTDFVPAAVNDTREVKVIIELTDDPVAVVEAKTTKMSNSAKKALRDKLAAKQKKVVDTVKSSGGKVTAQMQDAYNGVSATVKRSAVKQLSSTAGVKAVHAAPVYTISNATSVPYLGVPEVWESTGYTGEGVKVAIIDTGIDYTHADFGGPGTVAAYEAADATDTVAADPNLFGPNAPRIKGGYDFVGDDYDANDPTSLPVPDPNPLDCQGHGSHVAGSAGGGGVTADGLSYSGPYDSTTASKSWKVGPGVAPEADLYALRVFGCGGSTDVTTEAIDWAVMNGMDVINMSLGSTYGTTDDPSSVAASNAVAAGVVVVASAGNSGPNPYLTGSPGVGHGVVSVAANDGTESFPGLQISLADGSTIPALNANGLDPVPSGPYNVVVLKDDPATSDNEALGCHEADFTSNGITAGANQLAVTVRGNCARVARAVYGQLAGAAAVAMVNTTADYPPYEGPIVGDPEDASVTTEVTIPFVGVRGTLGSGSDGDKLVAAEGTAATLDTVNLQNPGFSNFASFSSGGPANGNSILKPGVVAPGVSIASAGVGTGNDYATMSGTSMAAPHVAGVAALAVEAHPTWAASDIAASLVNTADPDGVGNYSLRIGGAGLVDTAQVVASTVTATGDTYEAETSTFGEPSLSFGFVEDQSTYSANKMITVTNHGTKTATYTISVEPTADSRPATVKPRATKITVPAGRSETVDVRMTVQMGSVGTALDGTTYAFHEVSGSIVLTGEDTLRVPYLLVPRAQANVTSSDKTINPRKGGTTVTLKNRSGALSADADFYQLGLTDAQGDSPLSTTDLRALGVQSFEAGDDQLLVFAVNSWNRVSNAASLDTDIVIDTNKDGDADYVVFAADSGLVLSDDPDGSNAVFVYDVNAGTGGPNGFLAASPTDNSTILIPVWASSLGLTSESGTFAYTGYVQSLVDNIGYDDFDQMALYDPWKPALANGMYTSVPKGKTAQVQVTMDKDQVKATDPAGVMIVVFDNAAGAEESLLLTKVSP